MVSGQSIAVSALNQRDLRSQPTRSPRSPLSTSWTPLVTSGSTLRTSDSPPPFSFCSLSKILFGLYIHYILEDINAVSRTWFEFNQTVIVLNFLSDKKFRLKCLCLRPPGDRRLRHNLPQRYSIFPFSFQWICFYHRYISLIQMNKGPHMLSVAENKP